MADDDHDLSLDKPESIPGSVIAAIVALGAMMAFNALALILILLNVAQHNPRAVIQPAVSLALGALIMWGLIVGHRLAWQWGRVLGLLGAILYTIAGIIMLVAAGRQESPAIGIVVGVISLFAATCLWVIFFAVGMQSARFHFGLRCPQCGRFTSQAADFFFNKAKCRRCNITW